MPARLCALILFCVVAVRAFGQATVLPASDATKYTAEVYIERYQKQTKDYSNAGLTRAVDAYIRDRGQANDERAKRDLSWFYRTRLPALRESLMTVGLAANRWRCIGAGGGSMYGTFLAYAAAKREEFISEIVAMLSRSRVTDEGARDRANKLFGDTKKTFDKMRDPSGPGKSDYAERTAYPKLYQAAQLARIRLISIAAALPDRAAEKIARRLKTELLNGTLQEH